MVVGGVASAAGCLSCSHCQYAKRADAAQTRPSDAIGYVDASESYGVVMRKTFLEPETANATNDLEVAKMALRHMGNYGDVIEVWATDVADVGVAERYLENFANDKERGSMAWRCWQIGGYRCGNVTR